MALLLSLHLVSALLIGALADPAPGRTPKVYNALITSNQNLEPSKAYPVYQPVLHDAFAYSFQPTFFYGGDLIGNGLLPPPALAPKTPSISEAAPNSTPDSPAKGTAAPTEAPVTTPEPEKPESESKAVTPSPPAPPKTESPIPLNEFGLPPQVVPLGHIDPVYNALPQFNLNPFAYRYPGFRLYDPYDPFNFNPYAGLPSIYRPVLNVFGSGAPAVPNKDTNDTPESPQPSPPPSEPSDLNILNYASKDPAIPNVPPPPLPQGGLKSDKSE